MKISLVIKRLEQLKTQYGDIEVCHNEDQFRDRPIWDIYFRSKEQKPWDTVQEWPDRIVID